MYSLFAHIILSQFLKVNGKNAKKRDNKAVFGILIQ